MANIRIIARNFSGTFAVLNGTADLQVTWLNYLQASLTVGFQRFGDLWNAGLPHWSYRFGQGLSSIAMLADHAGNLRLSDAHDLLDGSEKAAVSYWHAMVFAKLVAERKLEIPWLAHVDDMRKKRLLITATGTKERGDLAGRDKNGGWHVIEAKGRSSHSNHGLVAKAKHQASLISTVAGHAPLTTSACISCLWKSPIEVILDDPPINRNSTESWQFEDDAFWKYYYGSLAKYIQQREISDAPVPNYRFAVWPPRAFDLPLYIIGLPKEIVESPISAPNVLRKQESRTRENRALDGVVLIGPDPQWSSFQDNR